MTAFKYQFMKSFIELPQQLSVILVTVMVSYL